MVFLFKANSSGFLLREQNIKIMENVSKLRQKNFALKQLAPYLNDNSLCGFDEKRGQCRYLTDTGKMCIAGKNFRKSFIKNGTEAIEGQEISNLIKKFGKKEIFTKKAAGILTPVQWKALQGLHDSLAQGTGISDSNLEELDLFTKEELIIAANKI